MGNKDMQQFNFILRNERGFDSDFLRLDNFAYLTDSVENTDPDFILAASISMSLDNGSQMVEVCITMLNGQEVGRFSFPLAAAVSSIEEVLPHLEKFLFFSPDGIVLQETAQLQPFCDGTLTIKAKKK